MDAIIVKIYTEKLGISRKEVIHFISELGKENLFLQAENYLD